MDWPFGLMPGKEYELPDGGTNSRVLPLQSVLTITFVAGSPKMVLAGTVACVYARAGLHVEMSAGEATAGWLAADPLLPEGWQAVRQRAATAAVASRDVLRCLNLMRARMTPPNVEEHSPR